MNFKRFDKKPKGGTAMAFKIPYAVRLAVETVFYPYIRTRIGLTLIDAYFHCIEKAWALCETDRPRFLRLAVSSLTTATGEAKGKNNVVMTEGINEKVKAVQDILRVKDKRVSFIVCVAVGAALWREEFGTVENTSD